MPKRCKLDLTAESESDSGLRREVLVKQAMAIPEIKILKGEDEVLCIIKTKSSEEILDISDDTGEIVVVPDSSVELEELPEDSVKYGNYAIQVEEDNLLGESVAKTKVSNLEVKSCKTKKRKREEIQVTWRFVRRSKRKTKYFSFCESYEGAPEVVTLSELESGKVPKVLELKLLTIYS